MSVTRIERLTDAQMAAIPAWNAQTIRETILCLMGP